MVSKRPISGLVVALVRSNRRDVMMTIHISQSRLSRSFRTTLRSVTLGMLAVLITAQLLQAAPQRGRQQRSEPELAPPKLQKMTRPTRPAEMQASQPIIGDEVFVERFPDGTIKVEREVTLDPDGNYVNHGPWRQWNKAGKLLAEGSYHYGKKASIWTRWYDRNDAKLLSQSPFRQFKAPFLSQASFEDGVMNGEWSIFDAQQNRCCQISITQGKRDGMTLFWLPDGTVLLQSMYEQGVPMGDVLQLDTKTGKLTESKKFLNGRQLITKKSMYKRSRQVQLEGNFLAPTSVQTSADSFSTFQFAKYEPQGEELRHGKWQEWYPNGQPKMSGQYNHDKKVGQFTYWHSNGQKAAEGQYLADKHEATWVWWHQNGQKSVTGSFQNGLLVDQWRWWAEDGKLTKQTMQDGTQTFEAIAQATVQPPKNARSKGRTQR